MEAKYLFVLLTLALTIGYAFILNQGSVHDIQAHWAERRCDFDIILSSFLYKPDSDTRSSAEFASDNFQFCVSSKATTYLETIFGTLFEVLRKQFAAGDIMTQVFKVLRAQLNTIYQPFAELINRFFVKFKQIGSLASRIFQHLYMAMKKAAATAIASIFVALSLQTAFMNTIDFVIKIIMIVLYILMGLVFVFFLPILPLLVIVLLTVSGIETAMPGSTGPMGSVFCFKKDTPVVMKNGTSNPISTLKPNDVLQGDIVVQAVIEVPNETLYELDGILVSGYHCLYEDDDIIYVKDHPRARVTEFKEQTLWTLITDKREIPVMGSRGLLRFLDWDEIPDSRLAEISWDLIAYKILNQEKFTMKKTPSSAPCIDRKVKVLVNQGGWRPLSQIEVGQWIYGNGRWTKVVGKCERIVHTAIGKAGNRLSDGNWILFRDGSWNHPPDAVEQVTWQGIQLITDSGCFRIQLENGNEYVVRDFTEVGSEQILESHARVESLLEKA